MVFQVYIQKRDGRVVIHTVRLDVSWTGHVPVCTLEVGDTLLAIERVRERETVERIG